MRAGACDKDASGAQEPHRSIIDFFISTQGAFQALLILGKGGWVQDDGVVAPAIAIAFAHEVESVRLDAIDILQPIPLRGGFGQLHRRRRNIDGFDMLASIRDLNRKSTGIAERVQRISPSVSARGTMIVSLI